MSGAEQILLVSKPTGPVCAAYKHDFLRARKKVPVGCGPRDAASHALKLERGRSPSADVRVAAGCHRQGVT